MDADKAPPERYYCVEFINAKGGRIGIQGIMTRAGWPCLDHGLSINAAPPPSYRDDGKVRFA